MVLEWSAWRACCGICLEKWSRLARFQKIVCIGGREDARAATQRGVSAIVWIRAQGRNFPSMESSRVDSTHQPHPPCPLRTVTMDCLLVFAWASPLAEVYPPYVDSRMLWGRLGGSVRPTAPLPTETSPKGSFRTGCRRRSILIKNCCRAPLPHCPPRPFQRGRLEPAAEGGISDVRLSSTTTYDCYY